MFQQSMSFFEPKLERLKEFLKKRNINANIVYRFGKPPMMVLDLKPEHGQNRDTQISYLPTEEGEDPQDLLIYFITSFEIGEDNLSLEKMYILCDGINVKCAVGTLFVSPADNKLYCRYALTESGKPIEEEVFLMTVDMYLHSLSMICQTIDDILHT